MNRPLKYLLKTGVSAALLGLLLYKIDIRSTLALLGSLDPVCIAAALALGLLGILISAYKWSLLLRGADRAVPFARLLRLFWIGIFFNNLLPGRTGGDLVRAYGIARDAKNRAGAAFSVVADRALNLASLVVIGLVALLVAPETLPEHLRLRLLYGGAALCGVAPLLVLACSRRFRRFRAAGRIAGEAVSLLRRPALLLKAGLLAAVYQATVILNNYAVAQALGLKIAPGVFFCLIPITALVTMLPVSLNGFGIREGIYAITFARVSVPPEAAVAISLAATLCMVGLSLVGGLLYLSGPVRLNRRPITNTFRTVDVS